MPEDDTAIVELQLPPTQDAGNVAVALLNESVSGSLTLSVVIQEDQTAVDTSGAVELEVSFDGLDVEQFRRAMTELQDGMRAVERDPGY